MSSDQPIWRCREGDSPLAHIHTLKIICTLTILGKISLRLKEKKQIQKQKEVKKKKPRIPIKGVGTGSQAWQCELFEKIFSLRKKVEKHVQDDHQ